MFSHNGTNGPKSSMVLFCRVCQGAAAGIKLLCTIAGFSVANNSVVRLPVYMLRKESTCLTNYLHHLQHAFVISV